VAAVVLLGVAWPALLLPYGLFLWLAFGVVGLVFVWASSVWTRRWKVITTGIVVASYALLLLLTFPASMRCSSDGREIPCPVGAPSPVVSETT
jgi:hypothetical protein